MPNHAPKTLIVKKSWKTDVDFERQSSKCNTKCNINSENAALYYHSYILRVYEIVKYCSGTVKDFRINLRSTPTPSTLSTIGSFVASYGIVFQFFPSLFSMNINDCTMNANW